MSIRNIGKKHKTLFYLLGIIGLIVFYLNNK